MSELMYHCQAYLPRESNSPGYVESGSLYALGLIHANHGGAIIDYLLTQTKETASEVPLPIHPKHYLLFLEFLSKISCFR